MSTVALRYRDVAAASDWLCAAFGFQRHFVATSETGVVHYAQLTFGNAMFMLASVGVIPRKDLLPALESALRMSNAAVVQEGNLVKIVPLAEAGFSSKTVSMGAGEPGYGVSIVPLRYISAATVSKTAEGFLSRPGTMRVIPSRNLVLVQGTTAERQLWSVWIGYILASVLVSLVTRVVFGTEQLYQQVDYPYFAAVSGLAFFALGGSYWGWCYALGFAFFGLAWVMVLRLEWATPEFGALWAFSLAALGRRLRHLGRAHQR